jgi:hypothetical protein
LFLGKEIPKCQQKRSISSKFPICKNIGQIFLNIFFEGKFARFCQHLIFFDSFSTFFFFWIVWAIFYKCIANKILFWMIAYDVTLEN